ncbi:hypothetical protein SMSP2_01827 [Limihaloglobus sulfuriphilus]|uniref:Transmembrane protein n=1 Tax=Limihaloglobus sulfuriphilus TaxID=1851148 RepID=A0A1Q2MFH4_9BACT|nr:hypothetical protein SMSP2_01827 [Limihaloglobus sulfuriphilus]
MNNTFIKQALGACKTLLINELRYNCKTKSLNPFNSHIIGFLVILLCIGLCVLCMYSLNKKNKSQRCIVSLTFNDMHIKVEDEYSHTYECFIDEIQLIKIGDIGYQINIANQVQFRHIEKLSNWPCLNYILKQKHKEKETG